MIQQSGHAVDLELLLRLRLVVARVGEMDNAHWWNTKGLLGPLGDQAISRGFPKTHRFVQARAVFAVATARCRQVFDPPGCMTLWSLPPELEEQFEGRWEDWLAAHGEWDGFFSALQTLRTTDLLGSLLELKVIGRKQADQARKLKRAADKLAVPIPGVHQPSDDILMLLAAGFFRGEPGSPAIPYARLEA